MTNKKKVAGITDVDSSLLLVARQYPDLDVRVCESSNAFRDTLKNESRIRLQVFSSLLHPSNSPPPLSD